MRSSMSGVLLRTALAGAVVFTTASSTATCQDPAHTIAAVRATADSLFAAQEDAAARDRREHVVSAWQDSVRLVFRLGQTPNKYGLLTDTLLAALWGTAGRPGLIAKAREFRALQAAGDYAAARAMATPEPRRWWEERDGDGNPWTIGPASGPWADWDEEFNSRGEVVSWRGAPRSATAVVRETNDYFQLLERGPVTNEITYFFDGDGRIEGLLIRAVGDRPPGRTAEFLDWAKIHAPSELADLMPDGEIDPSGGHPERFRALLERWREDE